MAKYLQNRRRQPVIAKHLAVISTSFQAFRRQVKS